MIVQNVESRTQPGGRLRNVRRLWQCGALPAVLVLATIGVVTGCPGLVSAGETNSHPAPQAATSFAPSLTASPVLPTATYGFNEGSGNTTADASGNANMGTLSGPSWTTAGRYGSALSFNGTNAYVEAANSNSLNPGTAATFSAWVNVLAASANISSVVNKWSQTIDDEYLFGLDSSNRLTFAWQTTGGNVWGRPSYNIVSGNAQVPLGTWTYITVVRNGPAISFYVNGNLDATFGAAADANPFRSGINTLRIGGQNRGAASRVLNGMIDEVRMYNQALTPAQIQGDMNALIGTPTFPPSITTQPVSQSVTVGQTASFSVAAAGAAPLSYQWQKNGANIVGATSASYTTSATMTSDSGSTFRAVVSNTAGTVTSAAATLTVNAAPAPGIQVSPASINFANAVVGTTLSQVLIVTNTGTATLSITQVTASGSAFAVSGFSLPLNVSAGQRATINVAFLPTAVGPVSGNISIASNAIGSPLAISLSGTGVASTFLLGANPTSLNFANVNVGSTSSLSVTLTNNGNSNVTISSVTVAGAGFSATGVTSGTVLTPNQSIALNPVFTPTAAGSVTGSVSVLSNATNSPATISLSGVGVTPASSAFTTWVAPSLVRVGPTNAPGTTSSISLSGARGETLDTQIIVTAPAGGLTNVNLSPSALTGPGGATIAASNVVLYREYYVTVSGTVPQGGFPSGGTNPPLGSGTYAEPLIPFNDPATGLALCGTAATLKACNATISAGQNQPYWIDISVPRGPSNSPPGTYTGTITVTSTQGNVTVPITVTVWNFELPLKPTELSEWTLWNPNTGNTVATLAQALMRNKVMSRYDNAISAVPNMATFGMNRVGLDGSFYIGMQCNGGFSSLPTQVQIAVAAATFPIGLALDEYVADELTGCSGAYSNLKTLARNLHASGVKSIATFNAVDPNLQDDGNGILPAIDHWVLLTAVQQWPALPYTGKGDLWSYTSCNIGFGNTPEWLIDYPPINERMQAGFLDWTQGATGVLYYRADGWSSGNAIGSWNNLNVSACGSGSSNPGDGVFLYPGGPIGSSESAPGIRLKAIRDGIQDYEYAQILKNLGQQTFVNSVIQPIATSWSNWSHDHNALENARTQLGQQLNQLSPP